MAEERRPPSAPAPSSGSPLSRFVSKVGAKIDDMTTLTVVTAVGSVEWKADEGGQTIIANTRAMFSEIDLIDGDVRTIFDDAFVTGDYKELRGFHESREEQGHRIIESNIAALKELMMFVRDLQSQA